MSSMQQIEALLFVAGEEGVTVAEIAAATGFARPAVLALLQDLAQTYAANSDSALEIMQVEDTYQLVTKAELAPVIHEYFTAPLTTTLSQASLEVLAIIAYQQPITRVEIDEIRGVQSQGTIQKLVLRDLVVSRERADEPGRPKLYRTSDYFLNYFGLTSLEALPPLVDAEDLATLRAQKDETVPLLPEESQFEVNSQNEEKN